MYMPEVTPANFDRADWLRGWVARSRTSTSTRAPTARAPTGWSCAARATATPRASSCTRPSTARPRDKYLPREFFESAEYQRIAELARTLAGLIGEGAYVTRGNERQEIGSFKEAMKWLFDQAKKGQTIQRYKGLGEMNPEQLWDTTINPETRRLLQVRIEDAVAADDIFTTLMGDQVEPRREFIEKNALSVINLDV